MVDQFSRIRLTLGNENIEKLNKARVAVFGIGGVGSYVVEALARSGIGSLDIIDNDKVSLTNINRQIIALHSTIGQDKVDVAEKRILDINPQCKVNKYKCFFLPENSSKFNFKEYDYVVDCIDTVAGKIEIVQKAVDAGVPVISCMGAGNKIDPLKLQVTDISQTSVCPLARVMRRELKKRGIEHLKVIYSTEEVIKPQSELCDEESSKKSIPGSNAFVPSCAGLIAAAEVIKDITDFHKTEFVQKETNKSRTEKTALSRKQQKQHKKQKSEEKPQESIQSETFEGVSGDEMWL